MRNQAATNRRESCAKLREITGFTGKPARALLTRRGPKGQSGIRRVMMVPFRRALCAVAATFALAGAAHAAAPVAMTFMPLAAAPLQSLAGAVDLSQTVSLPSASYGP